MGSLDAKVELLRTLAPDLALIQEIGRQVYRGLMPHPSAHERLHRRPRQFTWGVLSTDLCNPRGSDLRIGSAVLGGSTTALLDSHALSARTLATEVALSTGDVVTACSFHDRRPTGSRADALRRAFHTGIAEWIATASGPIFFGIDSGWGGGSDPLIGSAPSHHVRPVLQTDRDNLWASEDVEVLDTRCLADEAAAAGSDHALLLADLAVRG